LEYRRLSDPPHWVGSGGQALDLAGDQLNDNFQRSPAFPTCTGAVVRHEAFDLRVVPALPRRHTALTA
jgi:hypothetical protein